MKKFTGKKWIRALPLFGLSLLFVAFSIGLIRSFSEPVERTVYELVQFGKATAGESISTESWLEGEQAVRKLTNRAIVKKGQAPEVILRFPSQEQSSALSKKPIYVRAMALDEYDFAKGRWTAALTEGQVYRSNEDGWTIIALNKVEGDLFDHSVIYGGARGSGNRLLVGLQGLVAAEVPQITRLENGFLVIRQVEKDQPGRYRARSRPVFVGDLTVEEVGEIKLENFPSNLRLRKLSKDAVNGAVMPLEQLRNIESFMHENYKYSVNGDGLSSDPLSDFLFNKKEGHCELFATAAALLVRELGLKSRIVFGWAGGDFYEDESAFVFRSKHAHAWLEVELGNAGWVAMDPTAPSLGSGVSPKLAAPEESPPVEQDLAGIDLSSSENISEESPFVGWLMLSLFLIFLAIILWVALNGRRRSHQWNGELGERLAARGTYLIEWETAMRKSGFSVRGETLKAQIESLSSQPAFADELITYHYGITYEAKARDRGMEKLLTGKIRKWSQAISART